MNGIVNEKKGHNMVNDKNYQLRGFVGQIFSQLQLRIMNDKKVTIVNDRKVKNMNDKRSQL